MHTVIRFCLHIGILFLEYSRNAAHKKEQKKNLWLAYAVAEKEQQTLFYGANATNLLYITTSRKEDSFIIHFHNNFFEFICDQMIEKN